jgi:endonuclease/exonuclease/phosphatase family metal-dependent hydrolase
MDINIAFWNLGNLFDTVKDPISDDFDFTPGKGWTEATQAAKVANMASVIDSMFDDTGPDLLGVCEVENEATLQQLVDAVQVRDDLVVMQFNDGPDVRGIDCALVYSDRIFEPFAIVDPEPPAPKGHVVHNRYPTRDIFEVPLRVPENGAELIVYVNHWPSRSQGRYETEPLRIAAANHLGRLIDQRLKFIRQQILNLPDTEASMDQVQERWNRNILALGDFNDEPFNRSVLEELGASSGFDKLEEAVKRSGGNDHLPGAVPYAKLQAPLFNCMWPIAAMPDRGSYFFGSGTPTMNMLDQFVVSRGLYYGTSGLRMKRRIRLDPPVEEGDPPVEVELDTVWADVFDCDLMITSQQTRRPRSFRFDIENGVATHNDGFSDHFPIVTTIEVV